MAALSVMVHMQSAQCHVKPVITHAAKPVVAKRIHMHMSRRERPAQRMRATAAVQERSVAWTELALEQDADITAGAVKAAVSRETSDNTDCAAGAESAGQV